MSASRYAGITVSLAGPKSQLSSALTFQNVLSRNVSVPIGATRNPIGGVPSRMPFDRSLEPESHSSAPDGRGSCTYPGPLPFSSATPAFRSSEKSALGWDRGAPRHGPVPGPLPFLFGDVGVQEQREIVARLEQEPHATGCSVLVVRVVGKIAVAVHVVRRPANTAA